jgi:hypothetical protein
MIKSKYNPLIKQFVNLTFLKSSLLKNKFNNQYISLILINKTKIILTIKVNKFILIGINFSFNKLDFNIYALLCL